MMNAIKIGSLIINENRVTRLQLNRKRNEEGQRAHFLHTKDRDMISFDVGSAEGDAAEWWFTRADRSIRRIPGHTVDVVELHKSHLEAVAARPELSVFDDGPPRPAVAEAVVGRWESEGGAA